MSCPMPSIALLTAICTLGGCVPQPRADAPPEGTRRVPVAPVPCPADDTAVAGSMGIFLEGGALDRAAAVVAEGAPTQAAPVVADDKALAKGPSLRLNNETFQTDKEVLVKLQEALAEIEGLKSEKAELASRLTAADQAKIALQAEVEEFRRQVAQLSDDLRTKTDALATTRAELAAAKATVAGLEPKAAQADEALAQIGGLQKQLGEARAECEKLRDQALQAELARVKAQQDLVALQIVMARQKALVKQRPKPTEAKAPPLPDAPLEETAQ